MNNNCLRTQSAFQSSFLRTSIGIFCACFSVITIGTASAASTEKKSKPIGVVELFTSQGCYSCPPADEKLAEMLAAEMLANEPELLALEFHVDYWNDLVWGSDGTWQDPFSKSEYTLRQRQYELAALQGRTGVYTPQAVINGQYAIVGIDKPRTKRVLAATVPVDVAVSVSSVDDQLVVNVDNPDSLQGANIYLARFLKKTSTDVTGGENNRKQLHNVNVVTEYKSLGKLAGENQHRFVVAANIDSNMGCAVVVQSERLGPILGAAVCP
ncbi:MAG: DUF1223 domain-containing protein [Granulosicoccaceae bacterium]